MYMKFTYTFNEKLESILHTSSLPPKHSFVAHTITPMGKLVL